ncbi:MAG: hypothetical protein A2114_01825 [Candidatus Vogelbacteria bacterium GWA1_51_14]|uniref:Penicillin-binding C-terminal domain-containing protein n=1 Tax=Candidatus Vogelbacteria bacterium GWA1_51_14 TaxID=1802435 RepID=A0A1G2QB59_9BACT|nr:MAG: hypothetical protein A2114_01825 [Candidatus Vogelbacteria bacterium GWA1_51_14]
MVKTLKNKISPRIIAIVLAVVIVLGYGLARSYDLLAGPEIKLSELKDGQTISQELVLIKGQAKRIASLFLNGQQIFTNEEGDFREPLLLFPGYNAITLSARDKFGREVNKKIIIVNQS